MTSNLCRLLKVQVQLEADVPLALSAWSIASLNEEVRSLSLLDLVLLAFELLVSEGLHTVFFVRTILSPISLRTKIQHKLYFFTHTTKL